MALLDFDYLFWHNPAKINVAGTAPISLRLTLHGQRAEISTKIRCTASEWDSVTHRLVETGRHKHPAAKDYNRALDLIEGKVVLLRASLPADTTLPELRLALQPAPVRAVVKELPPPPPCALVLLEKARLAHPNHFTQAGYLTVLNKLTEYVTPATTLPHVEFTPEAARDFVTWLKGQTSEASATTYLTNLHGLWRRAFPGQLNPLTGTFTQTKRKRQKPRYVLSAEQLAQLASLELDTRPGIARDIYLTQYYLHGSRVGVILELTWQQVDWQRGRVQLLAEKGGDWQSIALRGPLASLLRSYLPGASATGFVFPLLPADYYKLEPGVRHKARKVAAWQVWDGLQTCSQLLGIPGRLHSHTARHTLATHTVQRTGDYRLAQKFLGHSSLEMTENYIQDMLTDELDAGGDAVYGD